MATKVVDLGNVMGPQGPQGEKGDPGTTTWDGITDKPSTFSPASHVHAAGDVTSGTLPVARGGTGYTGTPSILVNLAGTSGASPYQGSPRPGVTGTLPIAKGGTGATTAEQARANLGAMAASPDLMSVGSNLSVGKVIWVAEGNTGGVINFGDEDVGTAYVFLRETTDDLLEIHATKLSFTGMGSASPNPLPVNQGGTGRTTALPTPRRASRLVVGVSTAGWTSDDCDYLCDGAADDVELNAAVAALPDGGGEIVLLDGTYNLASDVTISKEGVTLRGNGAATKLVFNGGGISVKAKYCALRDVFLSLVTTGVSVSYPYFLIQGCAFDGSGATGTIGAITAGVNAQFMRVTGNSFYSCTDVFGSGGIGTGPYAAIVGNTFRKGAMGSLQMGCYTFVGNVLIGVTAPTSYSSDSVYANNYIATG